MTVSAPQIVSSESEMLILVDEDDSQIGTLSKAECHNGDGVLHRAFSLFVFSPSGELLLQKRSETKRLWPGYWSNSCCSHPRAGESMEDATARRLHQELGIGAVLEFTYKFSYQASFGALGSENELCSVFLGRSDEPIRANETEIADHRFVNVAELNDALARESDRYTPWFRMEWRTLNEEYAARLAEYSKPG